MVDRGGGAFVVVRAWENLAHGEGKQGTDRVVKTEEPSVDFDAQANGSGSSACNANSISGAGHKHSRKLTSS